MTTERGLLQHRVPIYGLIIEMYIQGVSIATIRRVHSLRFRGQVCTDERFYTLNEGFCFEIPG
jgi:hypothetical protein